MSVTKFFPLAVRNWQRCKQEQEHHSAVTGMSLGNLKNSPYDVIQTLIYCMADNSRKLMKHGVCPLAEVGTCIALQEWGGAGGRAGETTLLEVGLPHNKNDCIQ